MKKCLINLLHHYQILIDQLIYSVKLLFFIVNKTNPMNIPNLQLKNIMSFNQRNSPSQSPLFSPTGQQFRHNKNDSLVFSVTSHNFTGNKQQQINAMRNENTNQNIMNTNNFKDIQNSCSMTMPRQSMLLESRGSQLAKELNLLNSKLNALQDRVQHINSDRKFGKENVFISEGVGQKIEIDHVDFKLSEEELEENMSGTFHNNVHFPVTFSKNKKGNKFQCVDAIPLVSTVPMKSKSKENQKSNLMEQPLQPRGNSRKSIKSLKSAKTKNHQIDDSSKSFERSSFDQSIHCNFPNNSFQQSQVQKFYVGKIKKSSKIVQADTINRQSNSVRNRSMSNCQSKHKVNSNSNSSYGKSELHNAHQNVHINEFNNSLKMNLKEFNSMKKQMVRLQISAERSERSKSKTERDLHSSRKKLKQLKKETISHEKAIQKLTKELRKSQAIREKQKQIILDQKNEIIELKEALKKLNNAAIRNIRV